MTNTPPNPEKITRLVVPMSPEGHELIDKVFSQLYALALPESVPEPTDSPDLDVEPPQL